MSKHVLSWFVGFAFILTTSVAGAGEKPVYPRPLDEIKKTLAEILAPDAEKADEHTQALRKLKAYRYLAELPYKDVTLDENYNKMCLAGAKLCEKIGRLDHKPENPGLPEDEYNLGFKGTSQSNLGRGYKTLDRAMDAWMDDSDAGNIARLGHRRWCLNPTMMKTGFGRSGVFTAMFTFDRSRKSVPDYDLICYPSRGYMPMEFFGPKHAWSVTLNPKKYKAPDKDFEPKVYRADEEIAKKGEPLALNFKNVDTIPFGVANCIVFRPENWAFKAGERYVVELENITQQVGRRAVTLSYVVEFVKLQ